MADEVQFPEIPEVQMRAAKSRFPAYLLFKREKFCIQFHCSRCEKDWETAPPEQVRFFTPEDADLLCVKHKDRVICPFCRTECTAISIGKISTGQSLNYSLCFHFFIQRGSDELFVRDLVIDRIWSETSKLLEWKTYEYARYYLAPGRGDYYYPSWFSISNRGWDKYDRPQEYHREAELIGDTNLEHTFLKYNSYALYHRANPDDSAYIRYLCYYARYPIIEQLLKAGYGDFVRDLVCSNKPNKSVIDFTATSVKTALKVPREVLKNRFIFGDLRSCEFMRFFAKNKRLGATRAIRKAEFCFRYLIGKPYYKDHLTICKLTGENDEKIFSYFLKQSGVSNGRSLPQLYHDYLDYVDMARKVGAFANEARFFFPRDLMAAHDRISETYYRVEEEKRARADKKAAVKLRAFNASLKRQYAFEGDKYVAVLPRCGLDIVREGRMLSHCVAGYADRHFAGRTVIAFIRRKGDPGVPFFTVEISPKTGEFCQVRGYSNCPPDDSVQAFCDAWQAVIQKRRKKKEKKARETA
ncbi:MAG: PcfJ domain-containing protein [Eubacteriales bacterium]